MSLIKFKKIFATLLLLFLLASPLFFVNAYSFNEGSGLNTSATQAGFDNTAGNEDTLNSLIANIVLGLLGILGGIFLALVIFGSLTWMTAEGNEEKVKKANGTIMSALIGLIITLAAYSISYFVINSLWK
jgi:ABC-type spermidine/putrescine transport system permease subunit II